MFLLALRRFPVKTGTHRHMSQGAGRMQPPDSGKPIIFWTETSSQKWKKNIFLYVLKEKTKFILS